MAENIFFRLMADAIERLSKTERTKGTYGNMDPRHSGTHDHLGMSKKRTFRVPVCPKKDISTACVGGNIFLDSQPRAPPQKEL